MASVEKKIKMPDNSTVRYYVDTDTGLETLNMEDVARVFQGSDENKRFLASKMDRFAVSMVVTPTPPPKKVSPNPKKLSDFNQKLKQAGNFNPNKDKK